MASGKIVKSGRARPDPFERSVAQALYDLEINSPDLREELRDLHITAAKEVDVGGGRLAVVIFVPVPQKRLFNRIHVCRRRGAVATTPGRT